MISATSQLPDVLVRLQQEIAAVLEGIRTSRESIRVQALDPLRDTQQRLSQVSTTAESATMEMMNGLDRTLAMVDAVEHGGEVDRAEGLNKLREELNLLFGCLQFQDIITQQLRGITDLLEDIESRMGRVADLLDHSLGASTAPLPAPVEGAADRATEYNPDAQWAPAVPQSEIDAAFGIGGTNPVA